MQRNSIILMVRFLSLMLIPAVTLSMGGCPSGGGSVCGNGSVESGEECDDGNTISGDGCSSGCNDEEPACGDGNQDEGEECDDGNTEDDDGCSSTCQDEEDNPPPDADGDGVRDEIDECPGTTRGTEVDDVGCPVDSPADDSDDDGVNNVDDDCPNTPVGAPVDVNGCAANQLDSDGDGVTDNIDACERTPESVEVDDQGCPISSEPLDDDNDGVPNDIDQCPDTPENEVIDANGCSASQRDVDNDGLTDDVDDCPTQPGTVANNGCPSGGGGPICGNNVVEAGEQCDDGDTSSGDGCSSTCQLETSGIANDACANPTAVTEGTLLFSNVGATTDGPMEPGICEFFSNNNIVSDIWYCYSATCTGQAVFSLCGSGYDTKMAVYSGCSCPNPDIAVDKPIGCSDDDCGSGTDNIQSRVEVNVTAGQSYMVRVGGFFGSRAQGEGRLTIRCGQDTCANGAGDCFTAHEEGQPGCSTASCCNSVCDVDTFCCDVTWDAFCASQAGGFCTSGFPTCGTTSGACDAAQSTPGCNNAECCNAVCDTDPFCCITTWDANCVDQSDLICASCGRGRGDCFTGRTDPGCNDITCCSKVCAVDPFCCDSEWDATCADQALDLCGR